MRFQINKALFGLIIIITTTLSACAQKQETKSVLPNMPMVAKTKATWNKLTPAETQVMANKGTERAGTGTLLNNKKTGVYLCKRCNQPLYNSSSKFESNTGWPSFDDEIKGAVKHAQDADGERTELICANCGAHLGHAFYGEGFTKKNVRNCINSVSLSFVGTKK